MANISTSIVKTTKSYMETLLNRDKQALPKGFNSYRFQQEFLSVLNTLDLKKMQGQEFNIAQCAMRGAYLGLSFTAKECYVITYGNKPEFMTDYKGETKIAKQHSVKPIRDIYAKVVRQDDEFEEGIDHGQQYINFTPKPFNNNPIIGAFAVVYYEDGSMSYETMSTEEIEYIRDNFSKMPRGQAWSKSFGEMAKKTVLRRLCKHIEIDFDSIEQQNAWQEASDMEFGDKKKEEIPKEESVFEEEIKDETEVINEVEYEEVDE